MGLTPRLGVDGFELLHLLATGVPARLLRGVPDLVQAGLGRPCRCAASISIFCLKIAFRFHEQKNSRKFKEKNARNTKDARMVNNIKFKFCI